MFCTRVTRELVYANADFGSGRRSPLGPLSGLLRRHEAALPCKQWAFVLIPFPLQKIGDSMASQTTPLIPLQWTTGAVSTPNVVATDHHLRIE
jgi:hypothetical protein